MKEIFNRRSVRTFEEKPLEREKIERLLRAAMQAPSAGNQQPWEFIVVENRDSLNKLSEMSPYSKMVAKAPAAIIILGNKNELKYPEYWEQDLGAAAENILLEAVYLGLGGVWLGVAPLEDRMNFVKEMFGLPEGVLVYAVIPIGYAEGEQKFVDRYDSSRVHYEKY